MYIRQSNTSPSLAIKLCMSAGEIKTVSCSPIVWVHIMQPFLKAYVAHDVEVTFEGHTDKPETQHVMERGLPFPQAAWVERSGDGRLMDTTRKQNKTHNLTWKRHVSQWWLWSGVTGQNFDSCSIWSQVVLSTTGPPPVHHSSPGGMGTSVRTVSIRLMGCYV